MSCSKKAGVKDGGLLDVWSVGSTFQGSVAGRVRKGSKGSRGWNQGENVEPWGTLRVPFGKIGEA